MSYLTVWLVLLYGLSARQIVPGVGAIGSPAMLLVLPSLLVWSLVWLDPNAGSRRDPHPLRAALLVYLLYHLLSFAVASSRPLTAIEANGALRGVLIAFAMVGVALLVADFVTSVRRLTDLLRRTVYAAAAFAMFGLVQLVTREAMQPLVPGLTWHSPPMPVGNRGAFGRPASTGLHAIEYSVVVGAMFPLAIHFALNGETARQRRLAAGCAFVLGLAVPLSSTRTGLVSLVVGVLVLVASWRGRRLVNALIVIAISVPLLWALVPGVVGTFIGMFTGTDDDISIQARIRRFPAILELVRQRPLLGLGVGTWNLDDYFLIDNQVYVTTLELGIVGMVLIAIFLCMAVVVAATVRSLPGVPRRTGELAQAVAASIAAFSISLVTFDAFFYRILTGTLFLLIGAAGALWRLHGGTEAVLAYRRR